MAGPNTVFTKHEEALRKLARDAQDIVRISEQACSTYLKTEQKLHEDLSGLEKKVAEGDVQIKRLKAELEQVRGELTEAKQTLRDNGVTIATLEATVREKERTIGHVDLLRQYDWQCEKFKVWERDFQTLKEEKHQLRKQLDQLQKSEGKRPLPEGENDTAETDPKKERRG